MKRRQLATLLHNGIMYRIINDNGGRLNPYKVYADCYEDGKHHHRQIARYADLASAVALLAEIVRDMDKQ
jgi:hypothetical protein